MFSIFCSELRGRIDDYFDKYAHYPKKIVLGKLLLTLLKKEIEKQKSTSVTEEMTRIVREDGYSFMGIPIEIMEDCIII